MNIFISDVKDSHLPQIEVLEHLCFSVPWTLEQLSRQMEDKNSIFLVALNEKSDILGYAGLSFVLDEGYISNVAVSPEYRRLGVADRLIKELKRRAEEKGLAFLTLEVRTGNEAAVSLYSKHGFKTVGIRKAYYDRPKEDAVLMTVFFHGEEN